MSEAIHCLIVDDEPVAREILENHLSKIEHVHLLSSCKNAVEAFRIINSKEIDLVFLDINMPEISGLSFARSMTKDIKIIFTTAYREYAVDGFDLQAVDYLLKPISFERLLQAINKFSDERKLVHAYSPACEDLGESDSLFVRAERKMIRIKFKEILFLESISDYVKIHLEDRNVITRETLSKLEDKLPRKDFLKVHRSFLVAVGRIDSYTSEYIESGGIQIPISRGCKEEVMRRLGD